MKISDITRRGAEGLSLALLAWLALTALGCSDTDEAATPTQNTGDEEYAPPPLAGSYVVVDTGQEQCYDDSSAIPAPAAGEDFHGQDAQHAGAQPSYHVAADGLTVYDEITGLTWVRTADTDGDGTLSSPRDKLTWAEAQAWPAALNAAEFAGFGDWRLPTIKELYSLILFSGEDVSPESLEGGVPFIDDQVFAFVYGNTQAGERVIDSQWASSTLYVADTVEGQLLFGVNFADGRIKGYGLSMPGGGDKTFFVLCCRGNEQYGRNDFQDNGDGTVSDNATGLMWAQDDSGIAEPAGLNWAEALAHVRTMNAASHLGHDDWRLPSAKELQSIVDYGRSPDTSGSAALDPVFAATSITNEAGQEDYAFYWTSTTHASAAGGGSGAYVAFGRSPGYMNGSWVDVHGAGCQRSDPKAGDPADYPTGHGPQGDAIRVYNMVRLVRDI